MFAHRNISSANVAELERVERLVRDLYSISDAAIVLVSEEKTRILDGPTQMTTILFWIGTEDRYKLRIFKPTSDVDAKDLPPRWLRSALLDDQLEDCC